MTTAQIELYDTMTRSKRPFEPLEPGKVKLYSCGPTVYGDPHIGNFRSFVSADLLRRWLEYRGYDVTMVMNVTDIEDKTIRDSAKAGEPIREFTQRYTQSFLRGLDAMNILRATANPRATEYIPQMITFIQALIDKGAAYVADDGVYFDIDKYTSYGRLSGVDLAQVQATERMAKDEYDKESAQDFVLWKRSTPEELKRSENEPGLAWNSPWDRGRPGWHIECSVMTRDLLGDTLDIHAGGEDLVFPHHTNEIAQSETLTGKQFVRYWVHIRHLMINGKKMSKSLGNYVSFDEVLAKYSADAFRYFYLGTHYRRPLDYTDDAMKSAEGSAKRLENTLDLLDAAMKGPDTNLDIGPRERKLLEEVEKHRAAFEAAMDDDLDSHTAIDSLHAMSGAINEYLTASPNKGVALKAYRTYRALLDALGLFEKRGGGADKLTEDLIKTLIEMRNQYRKEKNYKAADEVRNRLTAVGVTLADNAEGTTWKIGNK
ncbi:TPA: cysteine--tRNA ligase [Candidatus Bathyarchaeota archaeon]|nr:cysteine--tRNA ligase [Candidatus Bathyarchaeota archaeon]